MAGGRSPRNCGWARGKETRAEAGGGPDGQTDALGEGQHRFPGAGVVDVVADDEDGGAGVRDAVAERVERLGVGDGGVADPSGRGGLGGPLLLLGDRGVLVVHGQR
ncbi:hypothetical protein [Streptomyces gardneri]|uniref:hypothetical protein n=1 Tax=Streptomyces gardneri TaxID=66892 RepID=UPI0035D72630